MRRRRDIHGYQHRLASAVKCLMKSDISEGNKARILEFRDWCASNGMSLGRMERYIAALRLAAGILDKEFREADKQDIVRVVGVIQARDYSAWTKATYRGMLKRFYGWLRNTGAGEQYPEEVRWIKTKVAKHERKLPGDGELITEDDIKRVISSADHPRDKALVAVLYEAGGRMGEIGSLDIGSVKSDQHGAMLHVAGKTGARPIRIVWSTPYLFQWLQCHPLRNDPSAPLWINLRGKTRNRHMQYPAFSRVLKRAFNAAGIKKRCYPHLFRHSRATALSQHLTEFQMNQYFGWEQGSDMPSTYVHLTGKNLDSSILKLNGVDVPESEQETVIQPLVCPRCDTMNPTDANFCAKCAGVLDVKTALTLETQQKERKQSDGIMNQLLQDPDVKKLLARKLQEMAA